MTVRLAVIGAGLMSSDHARIFAEDMPGATLQVLCDASEPRARALADRVGAQHVTTDPMAAISRADVDAVVIASPDSTHAWLSLASIAARKPVLCEKPLSQSSAECLGVMMAEQAAGQQFLQLGFMRRFDQSYTEMKASLQSGSLGKPLLMHNFHRNVETPASDFTADMAITNSAPHEFDVARFVLATDYASITAFQPKPTRDKVGPVFMVLQTNSGPLVNIEINNNATYGYDVRGELVGEDGAISLNSAAYTQRDMKLQHVTDYASDWRARYVEAYRRQNKAFLHFARTGAFSTIAADAWDGYCATMVAEAGVLALHRGQKVPVVMVERPDFYNCSETGAA